MGAPRFLGSRNALRECGPMSAVAGTVPATSTVGRWRVGGLGRARRSIADRRRSFALLGASCAGARRSPPAARGDLRTLAKSSAAPKSLLSSSRSDNLSGRSSPRAARLPPKAREDLRHAEKFDVASKRTTMRRKVLHRAEKFSDEQAIGGNEQAISAAGRRCSPEARDVLRKLAIGALEQAIFPRIPGALPRAREVLRSAASFSESSPRSPKAGAYLKE